MAKWLNYFISGKQFQKGQMATLVEMTLKIKSLFISSATNNKGQTNQMGQQFGPYDWKIREAEA